MDLVYPAMGFAASFALVSGAYSIHRTLKVAKLMLETERLQNEAKLFNSEAIAAIDEAHACAMLLRDLAVQSFMTQNAGTFIAWSRSFGNLHVQITSSRGTWELDTEANGPGQDDSQGA